MRLQRLSLQKKEGENQRKTLMQAHVAQLGNFSLGKGLEELTGRGWRLQISKKDAKVTPNIQRIMRG